VCCIDLRGGLLGRCLTTRALLKHHQKCFDRKCPICTPVKEYVQKQNALTECRSADGGRPSDWIDEVGKARHITEQADSIIQQTLPSGPGDGSMCGPMDPGDCRRVMPGVSGMPDLAPCSSGPGGLSTLQAHLNDLFSVQTAAQIIE
jgi:hypothetical protein